MANPILFCNILETLYKQGTALYKSQNTSKGHVLETGMCKRSGAAEVQGTVKAPMTLPSINQPYVI
jgi:uncharacterized protein (DUF2062 family)